jgi:ATP-dependent RNA helicase DeaD
VHRIGRVGRAGREGVAITLAEPKEQRLLTNIERLTKQKISVEKVPTVADLRARQIEITVATLRDALQRDDLAEFDGVLDALADEHDLRAIALAAVRLVHEASGATVDEKEIPDASHRLERADRTARDRGGAKPGGTGTGTKGAPGRDRGDLSPARIYVGAGRKDNVRAGDLVGAIANESNLSGRDIGPIKVAEHFSIVGVPEWAVDDVIAALQRTTVKGKKATVRRYSE